MLVAASFALKLFELLRTLGRGNFLKALPKVLLEPAAAELRSRLEADLFMKLLRRPGMSSEVRLVLFCMGGRRLELDGSLRWCDEPDLSSRRSEKDAEEIPPPLYGGVWSSLLLLEPGALRFVSSCSLTCFQRFMLGNRDEQI